jgi:hypothetical protein
VIRVLLARGREWGHIPADGFRLQAFICSGAHFLGLRIVSAGDSKGELALAHPCRDQPGGGDGDTVVDCCRLLSTVVDCCRLLSTVVDCCRLLSTVVAEKAIVPETPTPIAALRATRAYTVFASASKDSQLRGRIHRKNRPEEIRGYNRSTKGLGYGGAQSTDCRVRFSAIPNGGSRIDFNKNTTSDAGVILRPVSGIVPVKSLSWTILNGAWMAGNSSMRRFFFVRRICIHRSTAVLSASATSVIRA